MKVKPTKTPKIRGNKAIERFYRNSLQDFSSKINKSFKWWVLAKFNQSNNNPKASILKKEFDKLLAYWEQKANDYAGGLSKRVVKQIKNYVDFKYSKQGFKVVKKDKNLTNEINSHIMQNQALIKSIPADVMLRYQSTFFNAINAFDREALEKQARTIEGISHRRAKTIARDQTHKALIGYINARSQKIGVEFYEWVTSEDERVSTGEGGHKQLNGRVYRYDTATAVVDSYGNKGHPSDRVNCRCVPVSVFLEPNQSVELVKDSRSGDYYKIIEKG